MADPNRQIVFIMKLNYYNKHSVAIYLCQENENQPHLHKWKMQ